MINHKYVNTEINSNNKFDHPIPVKQRIDHRYNHYTSFSSQVIAVGIGETKQKITKQKIIQHCIFLTKQV